MTAKLNIKYSIGILLMLLIGCYFYMSSDYSFLREYIETCKSNVTIENSETKISTLMLFHLFKHSGMIELNGLYTLKDGSKNKIDRQISFNLVKIKDKYIMTGTRVSSRDDEMTVNTAVKKLLPDFFMNDKAILVLDKISSGNGERVFLRSGLPFLYCFRNYSI